MLAILDRRAAMQNFDQLVQTLPDIIKNASQSPLGIIALLAIILGILAWAFFRKESLRVRLAIWAIILLGAILFGVATVKASNRVSELEGKRTTTNNLMVTGTTVDAISNDAIGRAQITLVGRSESAVSDDNGNFTLEISGNGEPQISLRLRVSKDGYTPYDVQITAPANGFVVPLHHAK
jgi:hypothetical protein